MRVVLDTNVLVSAMLSGGGAARQVVRLCLHGALTPLVGGALFAEYEDLLSREALFERSALTRDERMALFDALMSKSCWTPVYFLWRPNLRDPADDHIVDLAFAGGASWIITVNLRDFSHGALRLEPLSVGTAASFLDFWRTKR